MLVFMYPGTARSTREGTVDFAARAPLCTTDAPRAATDLLRVYALPLGFRPFDSPPSIVSSVS